MFMILPVGLVARALTQQRPWHAKTYRNVRHARVSAYIDGLLSLSLRVQGVPRYEVLIQPDYLVLDVSCVVSP